MKTKYTTPKITTVQFEVEQGFAGSNGPEPSFIINFTPTSSSEGSSFRNDRFGETSFGNDNNNFFGD